MTPTPESSITSIPACGGVAAWSSDSVSYTPGMQVSYDNELYQCLQANTSQPDWNPVAAPSLWEDLGPCQSGTATPSFTPSPRPGTPTPIQSATSTRVYSPTPSFSPSPVYSPTDTFTPSPSSTPGGTPSHVMIGYWQDFNNGTSYIPLKQVPSDWDVIDVAFAGTAADYSTVSFVPDSGLYASNAAFISDVNYMHSQGKKVVLSIGGENGTVTLANAADEEAFVTSVTNTINTFGFDGIDLDIENGFSLDAGDGDFKNPTTPAIVNLIAAVKTICATFGPHFILSMAPQVPNVQGGITAYSGIWGCYLPIIYGLSSQLTYLQMQYYNNGGNTALDGNTYTNGTSDFTVAMTDMMLVGFPIAGNSSNMFPPVTQAQMVPGVPAAAAAAPSGGYIAPSPNLIDAYNYLIKGQTYGGAYVMRGGPYPNLGGVMTWSINWDIYNNDVFSDAMGPYIHGLP